jgi:hypothetical protein
MRPPAALALVLVLGGLVFAGGGAAKPAVTIAFKGTATLRPFDVTRHCGATSVSAKLLRVRCFQAGRFVGVPAPGGASFSWTWDLPTDRNGHTTGPATEHGTLILNFGAPGRIFFALGGQQAVVGDATATRATAITQGTWKVTKGTKRFVGKHGTGVYTFKTGRTDSESLFSIAELRLSGSIT